MLDLLSLSLLLLLLLLLLPLLLLDDEEASELVAPLEYSSDCEFDDSLVFDEAYVSEPLVFPEDDELELELPEVFDAEEPEEDFEADDDADEEEDDEEEDDDDEDEDEEEDEDEDDDEEDEDAAEMLEAIDTSSSTSCFILSTYFIVLSSGFLLGLLMMCNRNSRVGLQLLVSTPRNMQNENRKTQSGLNPTVMYGKTRPHFLFSRKVTIMSAKFFSGQNQSRSCDQVIIGTP